MPAQSESTAYRLHWIDGFGSVGAAAESIHALRDDQVESMGERDRVELWQATRLLTRIGLATALQWLH